MGEKPTLDGLEALEESLKKLRTAYEKYFVGVERLEPAKERDELKATLRRLSTTHNKNTAWRFRLQTLQASLITHENYWNRVSRQIEEGSYKRDLLRAAKVRAAPEAADDAGTAAALPAARTPEATADLSKYPTSLRKLYETYARARAQTGEAPVSIDEVASTVRTQMQAIKKQTKSASVEFRITIKDGHATLKAVPK